MLTNEEFDKLEKQHQELMKLIDEQLVIVDFVNKSNPIKFMFDYWFYHRSKKAREKAKKYLKESIELLCSL